MYVCTCRIIPIAELASSSYIIIVHVHVIIIIILLLACQQDVITQTSSTSTTCSMDDISPEVQSSTTQVYTCLCRVNVK